ncbi:unnamed protein product [Discosporangium mesarthrocarpum]
MVESSAQVEIHVNGDTDPMDTADLATAGMPGGCTTLAKRSRPHAFDEDNGNSTHKKLSFKRGREEIRPRPICAVSVDCETWTDSTAMRRTKTGCQREHDFHGSLGESTGTETEVDVGFTDAPVAKTDDVIVEMTRRFGTGRASPARGGEGVSGNGHDSPLPGKAAAASGGEVARGSTGNSMETLSAASSNAGSGGGSVRRNGDNLEAVWENRTSHTGERSSEKENSEDSSQDDEFASSITNRKDQVSNREDRVGEFFGFEEEAAGLRSILTNGESSSGDETSEGEDPVTANNRSENKSLTLIESSAPPAPGPRVKSGLTFKKANGSSPLSPISTAAATASPASIASLDGSSHPPAGKPTTFESASHETRGSRDKRDIGMRHAPGVMGCGEEERGGGLAPDLSPSIASSNVELDLLRAQVDLLRGQVAQRDHQLQQLIMPSSVSTLTSKPLPPLQAAAAAVIATTASAGGYISPKDAGMAPFTFMVGKKLPTGRHEPKIWSGSPSGGSARPASLAPAPGGVTTHGMEGLEKGAATVAAKVDVPSSRDNGGGGGRNGDHPKPNQGSVTGDVRSFSTNKVKKEGQIKRSQEQQQKQQRSQMLSIHAQAEGLRVHRDMQLQQLQQQQQQQQQLLQRRQQRQNQRQREEALRLQQQQKWIELGSGQFQQIQQEIQKQIMHEQNQQQQKQHHQQLQHRFTAARVPAPFSLPAHLLGHSQGQGNGQPTVTPTSAPSPLQEEDTQGGNATAANKVEIALRATQARLERVMKALRTVYATAGEEVNANRREIEVLKSELKAARKVIRELESGSSALEESAPKNLAATSHAEKGTRSHEEVSHVEEPKSGCPSSGQDQGKTTKKVGVDPSLLMAANFELSELQGSNGGQMGHENGDMKRGVAQSTEDISRRAEEDEIGRLRGLLEHRKKLIAAQEKERGRLAEDVVAKKKELESGREEIKSLSSALDGMARQLGKKGAETERLVEQLREKEIALAAAMEQPITVHQHAAKRVSSAPPLQPCPVISTTKGFISMFTSTTGSNMSGSDVTAHSTTIASAGDTKKSRSPMSRGTEFHKVGL